MSVIRKCIAAATLALPLAIAANAANAATTLTLFGDQNPEAGPTFFYDANDDRATLLCSLNCQGLLSTQASGSFPNGTNVPDPSTSDGFSNTAADLFDLADSSDATELAFVNLVTGSSFASGTKTDVNADTHTFVSNARFILLKIGADPNVALIKNLSANNTFDFSALSGEGAGLSHIAEFGIIPLPAPLFLLLSGLGGLGFLGWRRRAAMA